MRMLNGVRAALAAGILAVGLVGLAACGDDDEGSGGSGGTTTSGEGGGGTGGGGTGGAPVVDSLRVSGTVVDFEAGTPVTGSATVSTVGLSPAPTISVTGADFEIAGVPPHSAFHVLAGSPPDYRNTYSPATEVTSTDVTGMQALVVSEGYLGTLAAAFNVSPAGGTAIVIVRVVDESGAPRAGVPAAAFALNNGQPPVAPRFLDDARAPDAGLNETSGSGYAIFYNVPPGLTTFSAAENSGFTIAGPSAPASANTVTLADVMVTDGGPVLPTNVSFSNDVVPIFESRGCALCHSGNSPGADLGNLTLNGGLNKIHGELVQEISPTHGKPRVDLNNPEQSLVLTMPSLEPEPDAHPNATFTSTADPDYLILLAWIKEGALQN